LRSDESEELRGATVKVSFANAANPGLLHIRAGTVEELLADGPMIGARHPISVTGAEVELVRGDALLVVSDGILEQRGPKGPFDINRAVRARSGEAPQALVDGLLEDVIRYAGPAGLEDDVSIVGVAI
jgi:serine phosphatase RsbU (regulator of sigma subunit)